jgi:hypothetical protein
VLIDSTDSIDPHLTKHSAQAISGTAWVTTHGVCHSPTSTSYGPHTCSPTSITSRLLCTHRRRQRKKAFHTLWRGSLKRFLRLPTCLPE